jgi:lyso-ornithine lipid O-acyltransferase
MRALLLPPLRVTGRLLWLGAVICGAGLEFLGRGLFLSSSFQAQGRAQWLHRACLKTLRLLGVRVLRTGPLPTSGLMVCNHLGYLDIVVLSALTPSVFVAKREVRRWPVFGWFAVLAGTIFVDRERRERVGSTSEAIHAALKAGLLVVLFPEGTSTGGREVLPFKSALLQPATAHTGPLWAGWIGYHLPDGDAAEEVCYWKDMIFLPHLLNLMSKGTIDASVRFAAQRQRETDRKALARQLHSEVLGLKEAA